MIVVCTMLRRFQRCLSTVSDIQKEVQALNIGLDKYRWSVSDSETDKDALVFDCKFKNFSKTWKFLNEVAILAHTMKHHPTITTTYNKVHLSLVTHDAGNKITYKDVKLALAITEKYMEEVREVQESTTKQVEDLLKTSRKQFSFTNADKMIDELLSLKNGKAKN